MGKSWKNHGARVVHPQSAVCPRTGMNRKGRGRGKSRGLESVLDHLQQAWGQHSPLGMEGDGDPVLL